MLLISTPSQSDPTPILVKIVADEGGFDPEQCVFALLPLVAAFFVLWLGQRHERRRQTRAERLSAYANLLDRAAAVQALVVASLEGEHLGWDVWLPANGALNAGKERAKMLSGSAHVATVESAVEQFKTRLRTFLSESRAADREIELAAALIALREAELVAASESEAAGKRSALDTALGDLAGKRYAYEENARQSFATFASELESVARKA